MLRRLLVTCTLLSLSQLLNSGANALAQQIATPAPVAKPRYLTTALRATAILLRDDDVLASDKRHLIQRVQLKPGGERPATSSASPATYPRRIVGLADGTVLLTDINNIFRVRLDGVYESLISGQQPQLLTRDATH